MIGPYGTLVSREQMELLMTIVDGFGGEPSAYGYDKMHDLTWVRLSFNDGHMWFWTEQKVERSATPSGGEEA